LYHIDALSESPKALGSLTLGGYDASRLTPTNINFPFDPDDDRPLSLNIQKITAKDTFTGLQSMLDNVTYVQIDFTVPHLWLPITVCDRFEAAFGLTYDNITDLYLVNDTIHSQLLQKNPSVTIGLGSSFSPTERVNLVLPYSAFDLQVGYPYYSSSTNYFPIRRAYNESQYTLGRTFMQEAYVTVDYERGNFSVSQALFPPTTVKQRITAIASTDVPEAKNAAPTPIPSFRQGISIKAVAGIAIGSVALVLFIFFATLIISCHRRKARRERGANAKAQAEKDQAMLSTETFEKVCYEMYEPGQEIQGNSRAEVDGSSPIYQLGDNNAQSLVPAQELPAGPSFKS
jgi:hypothetical protein